MTEATEKKPFDIKRLVPLIVILLVAVVGYFALRDVLSFDTLRDNREALIAWRDSNYALAAIVFIVIYVVVVAFSLPGAAVMTLAGGFLFGIFPGALFCVIGATLGAIAIFSAAKLGLGDMLHAKLAEKPGLMQKMEAGLRENEISFLFLMRLVPAIPFFLANLAPAFLGVSLRNFAFTTFFGIMPGSIVYTSVGSGLGEVFARGESPNLGIIFEPHILGPILGLCALAIMPIIIKKFTKKKDAI
ncbi:VTT domain-containing protein [Amylibacter sp. IMCC11727]|uniref:TVP38/TMEM64 family protein n=1 Tax=Amylibacter sp. IMCC11727 TaxID=3039851 RepID=UPI00244E52A2|nr:VTT domain-containing protein [Amylibacter sp. IMCC11727]WGI21685.1 VTT domain-containing protein [Amylibacter sp. IMCC11727]